MFGSALVKRDQFLNISSTTTPGGAMISASGAELQRPTIEVVLHLAFGFKCVHSPPGLPQEKKPPMIGEKGMWSAP